MKNISTFIVILALTGIVPVSCDVITCGGSGDRSKFTIVSMEMISIDANHSPIDPAVTHAYDNAFKTLYVSERKTVAVERSTNSPGLFPNALACSPAPPIAIEKFQDIKITSLTEVKLNDDNDIIHAGDDITSRFVIGYTFSPKEISQFLNESSTISDGHYNIRLKQKPFQKVGLQLKILVTLTDARTFEFDNEVLNVQ